MPVELNAKQVIERMRQNLGVPWKGAGRDKFLAGDSAARVTGIVTTYAPTLEVLRRAIAGKRNMVICRESPFWYHEGYYGDPPSGELLAADPAYRAKRELIQSNQLVIWKFVDNWEARKTDGQLRGLARALCWDGYHQSKARDGEDPYQPGDAYFKLPATNLQALVRNIEARLKIQGVRVIGEPAIAVSKAALMPGLTLVPNLRNILKEPGVDVVVAGEPVEWEAGPYFQDLIASGWKKGMILIGQQASSEPGSGEVAAWLKTFVAELPVEWIPAGEPSWVLQ